MTKQEITLMVATIYAMLVTAFFYGLAYENCRHYDFSIAPEYEKMFCFEGDEEILPYLVVG
tara:strand:+ start:311 stop:493 length:183 start_codon:yes stop_codon:yes gene_type:complete